MHASSGVRREAAPLALAEDQDGLVTFAGAAVGALGVVDLLMGLAMWGGAAPFDATFEGAPTAAAMRAYGLRVAVAGGLNLVFAWALFAEPGPRSPWLLLPAGLAASDMLGDAAALAAGLIPWKVLGIAAAVHEVMIAAVIAAALSAWRRERKVPVTRARRRRQQGAV